MGLHAIPLGSKQKFMKFYGIKILVQLYMYACMFLKNQEQLGSLRVNNIVHRIKIKLYLKKPRGTAT